MTSRIPSLVAFALPIAFAAQGALSAPLELFWWFNTVDSGDAVRAHSQPRYDKDGNLTVGYRTSQGVKHARLEVNTWKRQAADTGSGGDAKMDLAYDEAGNGHMIFQTYNDRFLYYTRQSGGAWVHKQLDVLGHNNLDFYQLAMASDKRGGVHAIYSKDRGGGNTSALYYAHLDKDGNAADTGFILPGNYGKWCSITGDKEGKPVVAFFRHNGELLEVAWKDGSNWVNDTIGKGQTPAPQGFHASIARKDDTTFVVAYKDRATKAIRMATGAPGKTWTTELVDTVGGFTFYSTRNPVVVGKGGMPFIAYSRSITETGVERADTSTLWLAYKEDTTWKHIKLDSAGKVGEFAAMTLGPDSTPVITYWDRSKDRIRIAVSGLTNAVSIQKKTIRRGTPSKSGPAFDASGRRQQGTTERPKTPRFRFKAGSSPAGAAGAAGAANSAKAAKSGE